MEKNIRRFFFSVFVQDIFAIPLAKFFIRFRISANLVTLMGLVSSLASGIFYLNQIYIIGSLFFFFALIFDSTDGRVARGTNTFSKFGANLDAITDKVRSFFVAFCFIFGLGLTIELSSVIFIFYIALPLMRTFLSCKDKNFYDPTILFWDATPFSSWFVKKRVWGFYNGWERSVVALLLAPIVPFKLELFLSSVVLEQLIFCLGLCFFKKSKIGS